MTSDYLEKQLVYNKQGLLASFGAVVTLLATTIADMPNRPVVYFPGWYAVWFVLLLATLTPAAVLIVGSAWRKLPFAERLNTIFGYLAAVWILLVAFGLKLNTGWPVWWSILSGTGIVAGIIYWLLRRRYITAPEAMFP